MELEFDTAFNDVFDSDLHVMACGRNKTSKLIELCKLLSPNIDFGDSNTGVMNIDNILRLRNEERYAGLGRVSNKNSAVR